jgi:alpha-galactosidase
MRGRRTVAAAAAVVVMATGLVGAAGPARGLPNGLARTPPMGFNDWNAFACGVSDRLIRASADAMVANGMRDAGYRYVNIDDCWLRHARDAAGRLVPDPKKFPHGIAGTADYVHARGMKLGIYEDAGAGTCGGYPGSLGHERQDARLFAAWGVDFLKHDWCNTGDLNPHTQYRRMRDALRAAGRPMVFSLSVWGVRHPWTWGPRTANLWRTTSDIKDSWQSVVHIAERNARHWRAARPGAWNDPDMLQVGNGGLTPTEERSHFSLWAEMAAPLLAGTDVRHLSAPARRTLLNREVIAVDQDRRGMQGRIVARHGAVSTWAKRLAGGDLAVLFLNEGDTPARASADLHALGAHRGRLRVRDLWAHRGAVTAGGLSAAVDRHGVAMFRVFRGRAPDPPAVSVAAETTPPYVPAGAATPIAATITNDGPRTVRRAVARLRAPAGWSVASAGARIAGLAPGRSATVRWSVRPPLGAAHGWTTLRPSVRFADRGHRARVEAGATVDVPPAPPRGVVRLDRHPWAYGEMTPTGDLSSRPRLRRSVAGKPMVVNGRRFTAGIGVNAWSDIRVFVGGACRRFTADVGVDDSAPSSDTKRGTVRVRVLVDGRAAFSRFLDWTMPAAHVDVPLAGATELALEVDATNDWIWDDATDWGVPRIACA